MERNIEQCPKCQNYTEGKPVYSQARQMTRAAVKKGSSQLIGAVIGFLVGIPFGPLCVASGIIGYIIGLLVSSSKTVSEVTDSVDQQLYSSTRFQFDCPKCGHSWQRTFHNGADTIPDSIIEKQQKELVNGHRSSFVMYIILTIICGAITAACGYYCFTHESSTTHMEDVFLLGYSKVTDINWTWWFLGFIMIVFLFLTLLCIGSVFESRDKANKIAGMTVTEFRNSPYRK